MRPRTLAVLAVVVAALLAFVWFYERELPSADERRDLAKRVLQLESDEITALWLAWGGHEVRLERGAEPAGEETAEWWLREPLVARADGAAVRRLLGDLVGLEKERTLSGADPSQVGLEEPRARAALSAPSGETRLLFGAKVPGSTTLILGVEGRDEAYVVAERVLADVTREPGAWRDRNLGPGRRDEIARLRLVGAAGELHLGRRGEEFWVEVPYADRADGKLVSALLTELTTLSAQRFVDEPTASPAELGLEPSAAAIEAVLEDREQAWRLELGDPAAADAGRRPARLGDQLVEIGDELDEAMGRDAEEWRDRSWSAFEVYQVERLTVVDRHGEMTLVRDAGEWLRDGAPIAYTPVSDLLYALTGIEAEQLRPARGPAAEAALTLTVGGEEREEVLTLLPPAAGVRPARASGRDVELLLAEGAVSELEVQLEEVRTAPVLVGEDAAELEPEE